MKIQGEIYETMKNAFRIVANKHARRIQEEYKDKLPVGLLWTLWNKAAFDLRNDDSHPAFAHGAVRLVPYTGFDIYAVNDGIADSHIETALKKIAKEINL